MDIQLPVIDGIEAPKIIRKKLPFPKNRVKIIANTTTNYKDFFINFMMLALMMYYQHQYFRFA
jgi:CheY-like chemotaxis protein